MKNFLRKSFWFLFILPIIWIVFVLIAKPIFDKLKNEKQAENSVFIWGDSQIYRGLDLALLRENTDMKIESAAEHGAGTYDFLIFAEQVPKGSKVIISISRTAQLRRVSRDRNMSGVSIKALKQLERAGYSAYDLMRVIVKNPRPITLFSSKNHLYPKDSDNFTQADSSLFETIYRSIPGYSKMKQELYLSALEQLVTKNCTILFLDFPYHSSLEAIEVKSKAKNSTDQFSKTILSELNLMNPDTFRIKNLDNYMHDYTHLDEEGARLVTYEVADLIVNINENRYLVIR